jgi:DNA (cytosine-5)-methyltransferase 1
MDRHEEYMQRLAVLTPFSESNGWTALDLFSGCGGLSLGFESLGFELNAYELEDSYAATHTKNFQNTCIVKKLGVETDYPKANVVIGGPPCQPFSVGGKQEGLNDSRNCMPAFISCIKQTKPDIFIFENVRGLLYKNRWYLEEIGQELADLGYIIEGKLVKLVNHGVPQNRERVFVVGHKGGFEFPEDEKIKFTVGDALGELAFEAPEDGRYLTNSMDAYVKRYEDASKCVTPRNTHLDKPARTLTCRNIAAATGDMHRLVMEDGRRRMLRIREAARLQSFPDWFEFCGTETEAFYQIGNAVPPLFSHKLAQSVLDYLQLTEDEREEAKGNALEEELPQEKDRIKVLPSLGTSMPFTIIDEYDKSDELNILLNQALNILRDLGIPLSAVYPTKRRREKAAMAFLAVCRVSLERPWSECIDASHGHKGPTTREIIPYINEHFDEKISSGSYDDIRRKDLRPAYQGGVVFNEDDVSKDSSASMNKPTRGWYLNPDCGPVVRAYGTDEYDSLLAELVDGVETLAVRVAQQRDLNFYDVELPSGVSIRLRDDEHNYLQKAVIEEFLPRFGLGCRVLYVGDSSDRILFCDEDSFVDLKIPSPSTGELPDIIAYNDEKNWLYVIEAVHSANPIDILRKDRLTQLFRDSDVDPIFISAFKDRESAKPFLLDIAWETEVWLTDQPDHMIHLNGDKFLGPYSE